jgi:hypothetical protein
MQEEFPELPVVRQYYPQFFHKTDRWGRPVWIELLGHIDVDHLLKVWLAGRGCCAAGGGRGDRLQQQEQWHAPLQAC